MAQRMQCASQLSAGPVCGSVCGCLVSCRECQAKSEQCNLVHSASAWL